MDCSSLCELMMSDRCGFRGGEIMFSSNDTPGGGVRPGRAGGDHQSG